MRLAYSNFNFDHKKEYSFFKSSCLFKIKKLVRLWSTHLLNVYVYLYKIENLLLRLLNYHRLLFNFFNFNWCKFLFLLRQCSNIWICRAALSLIQQFFMWQKWNRKRFPPVWEHRGHVGNSWNKFSHSLSIEE